VCDRSGDRTTREVTPPIRHVRQSGLVGAVFVVVLRQSNPIIKGCLAVIPGVFAVEGGVAAVRPIVAVPLFFLRGQELGTINGVPALVGGNISVVGGGVTLVGGVQDHLGGLHAPGKGSLPSRYSSLASFKIGPASFLLLSHDENSTMPRERSISLERTCSGAL
jgi:hypothetical protein